MSNVFWGNNYDKWETDPWLVDRLRLPFGFFDEEYAVDVCASRQNVCKTYWTEEDNGLEQDWSQFPVRWCNPPYGKGIGDWFEKACYTSGGCTLMLVKSATSTRWYHDWMPWARWIILIDRRLVFGSDEYWREVYWPDYWRKMLERCEVNSFAEMKAELAKSQRKPDKNSAGFASTIAVFGKLHTEAQFLALQELGMITVPV